MIHANEQIASPFLFPFWGKTDRVRDGRHSHLLAHMLAVGAVFDVLLEQPSISRVVSAAAKEPASTIRPLLVWVAALHDIGKLLPEFQNKCPWVVEQVGLASAAPMASDFSHGDAGYHQLAYGDGDSGVMGLCAERGNWSDKQLDLFGSLWAGAGAHHGCHIGLSAATLPSRSPEAQFSLEKAKALALYIWDMVERTIGPVVLPDLDFDKPLVQVFSGLVALADWIGSNEDRFEFIDIPTFETRYAKDAAAIDALYQDYRGLAASRVSEIGFATEATKDFDTLEAVFGKPKRPADLRPMQEKVHEIVRDGSPSDLLIIEDVMGAGKTEAALIAAAEWIKQGRAQGVVFALPSQASADQTFSRLDKFSEILFGCAPNLSHGNAAFSRSQLNVADEQSTGNSSRQHLSEWITSSNKRAFLAPVCAATVDQIMLAAMDCRHGFVRAACIARHAVIIDEVHAYDEYMGSILHSLLELLGACGTPVVLLSATLPVAARVRYMNAYRTGCGLAPIDLPALPASQDYPLLSIADRSGGTRFQKIPLPESRPEVAISVEQDAQIIYAKLLGAAREGCSAMICNTVGSAMQRYEEIKRLTEGSGINVILLHARFRSSDRHAIATRILKSCGKREDGPVGRGNIIVATQVIEQSLDLDFDYMASELAPIDLLLQRMGRLFRHHRLWRPDGFQMPLFDVLAAESGKEAPTWMRGTSKIYDNASIMDGTLAWLRANESIILPMEVCRAVAAVYDKFVQNKSGNNKQVRGADHALDFMSPLGHSIAYDTEQSSDTRDSEPSARFLLVRVNDEGLPLDLLNGRAVPWLNSGKSAEISADFLDYANQSLVTLRKSSGSKNPAENACGDMEKMAQSSKLNQTLAALMKHPPFSIVECIERRPGALDRVAVGKGYQYSKEFGFKLSSGN